MVGDRAGKPSGAVGFLKNTAFTVCIRTESQTQTSLTFSTAFWSLVKTQKIKSLTSLKRAQGAQRRYANATERARNVQ